MKKTFEFGKIAYQGDKKINPVSVEIELRTKGGEETFTLDAEGNRTVTGKRPEYLEFAATGTIWNPARTDACSCGQCLDEIAEYVDDPLFREIYEYWKTYHLNGLRVGTPVQETALRTWKEAGNVYAYDKACDYLKSIGLYTVPFYGKTVDREWRGEEYTYGHGWCIEEIPEDVVQRLYRIMEEEVSV